LTMDRRILFFLTYLSGRQTSYNIEPAESGTQTDESISRYLSLEY
jgi:hypothetical protein